MRLLLPLIGLIVSCAERQPTKTDETAPTAAADSSDPAQRNPAHRLLIGMSDRERSDALARFMDSNGERCGTVRRSFYQGSTPRGEATWNIECSETGDWAILVEPDAGGSTTITECGVLRTVGVRCWDRFNPDG